MVAPSRVENPSETGIFLDTSPVKRFLAGLFVVAAGFAAVAGYSAASRERDYRTLLAVGDAATARQDMFVAVEAYSGAIALKPDAMLGYLRRGEAYHSRGELQNARRDLRRASELDPSATRPLEALGDVTYALREFERAADRYASCARLDDSSPRLLYKLGLASYHSGRAGAAIAPLARAVTLDPKYAEAHYVLGLALRDLRRIDEAIEALETAVALSPGLAEARAELATIHEGLGQTTQEIEQLEALAALVPRAERAVQLGSAYARAGRTNQAVLTLGAAADRFPEHAQVFVALGRVWLEVAERRHDRIALGKATEALESALGAAEPTSETLALFGRALYLSGDLQGAEQALLDAIRRAPVAPVAYAYLADAAERLAHPDRAVRALIAYRALLGEDAADARGLAPPARIGDLAMRSKDPVTAVTWYRRASETSPTDAGIFTRLAEAAWDAEQPDLARTSLARALELQPRDRAARQLRQRIK
jgi:tetratricopeptide (TPR) repeat protein